MQNAFYESSFSTIYISRILAILAINFFNIFRYQVISLKIFLKRGYGNYGKDCVGICIKPTFTKHEKQRIWDSKPT